MALSNRINMRGGGGDGNANYIYNKGTNVVQLDSNITNQGYTFIAPQYNPTNIFEGSSSIQYTCGFATTAPVDLTNASTVYFKVRCSRYGTQFPMLVVASQKTAIYEHMLVQTRLTAVTDDYVTYALDVSALTSGYICVLSTNCDCYVDSVWYE